MKKIITGLLLGIMAVSGYGSEEDVFTYKVGRFEVFMLVEGQRPGNTEILVNADEAVLREYIPEEGFMHSTNAFLIKMPGRNILVDTGTGRQGEPVYEKIKKLGVGPEQIDAVLLTHLHGDHFGGLLKDGTPVFSRAKIYLSAAEYNHFIKTQPNEGAVAALAPYGSRVVTFEPNELNSESGFKSLLPGIAPIAAYGHTPGHTMYLFADVTGKFLIWGDLLHIALVQFPVPEISATYDMDGERSAAIRRQVMDYAASTGTPVGGMHIVYPAVGNVETDSASGGFRFIMADGLGVIPVPALAPVIRDTDK
jgi:glyoxylase-like metal-dependent hydrolase (beta-lactamase superfamily II)